MPVTTTMQAVSSGIPPIDFDISTAIGVVTDFGINEVIIFQSECINLPRMNVVVIAVKAATINPKYTALLFFFKRDKFSTKGNANEIVAGPNKRVYIQADSL